MRKIFISKENISANFIKFDKESANHAFNVLRLKEGSKFKAVDGAGNEFEAVITNENCAKIISVKKSAEIENVPAINLYLAKIKQPRFETALEKCTEIGVSSITPVTTKRCLPYEINENRIKRFNTIIEQATRQCERFFVPELRTETSLEKALEKINGLTIVPDTSSKGLDFSKISHKIISQKDINIFIGPEGGFTADEISLAKGAGAEILNLGSNILRTETAAIVTCSLIKYGKR